MALDSRGTKGQPQFSSSGVPAIDVDPSQVADYAAMVGNHIVGTTTQRLAAVVPGTSTPVWDELWWSDSTDGRVYQRISGSWVLNGKPADGVKIIRTGTSGQFSGGSWTVLNNGALWAVDQTAAGVTVNNGVVTVALAGLYEASGAVMLDTTCTASLIVKKNSTTSDTTGIVGGGSNTGAQNFTIATCPPTPVKLAANDTLALAVLPSVAAQWSNDKLAASFFSVRYVEPAR